MGLDKTVFYCFILTLLFFISDSLSQGQPDISLYIEGKCKEFNVTLITQGLENGCYDAKIDVTAPNGRVGEILDPKEGWKSSFFYIIDDFCADESDESVTYQIDYQIRADTEDNLNVMATLRLGERTWNSETIQVAQDCPETSRIYEQLFWITTLSIVLILVAAITFYVKRK